MRKKKIPQKFLKPTRKKRSYTHETLLAACKAIENGMTAYKASQCFGIPKQTLEDRKKGKVIQPDNIGSGRHALLEKTDENKFVQHINYLATLGYGYSKADVVQLATEYAQFLGVLPHERTFTNGWLIKFFGRWPELNLIKPRSSKLYRAKCVTPEAMQSYFCELKKIMDKYDFHTKPHCIYNVEETRVNTEHKPGKVLALKGSKPAAITGSRSATVTVIACGNAIGTCIPPFIIFKGKRKSAELSEKCTTDTEVRMSDTGWSNSVLFSDFLENHFQKFTMGSDSDFKLLLYDGHASHINISLIEWARDHKMILFLLPPHTSHLIQPLDTGCFGHFKRLLFPECADFMRSHASQIITRYDLGNIICTVYPKALSAHNLMSSFRKTGIYPFDATVIDNSTPSVFTGNPTPNKPTDADTDVFLMGKDPLNAVKEASGKKPDKKKVKFGGSAITESPLFKFNVSTTAQTSEPDVVPSCSKQMTNTSSDSESDDMEITDDEKCCVCDLFEPAGLKNQSSIELVNWAQCDKCCHWVHLKFCVPQRIVRCNTCFLCPHCPSE